VSSAAPVGGYPLSCSITGALDCNARKLVDGWIRCTYCLGPADGGTGCSFEFQFAGTMTGNFDSDASAFVNGGWNASEALGGNDGGSPGPDGGPPSSYLLDSGRYGPGIYGGSGTWSASWH
jgi:hypothetical protein